MKITLHTLLMLTFILVASPYFSAHAQSVEEMVKITPSDRKPNTNYGYSVALDGKFALVGCPDDGLLSNGKPSRAGSAYLYEQNEDGEWLVIHRFLASDSKKMDFFGRSVAIQGDFAFVGASGHDFDEKMDYQKENAGAVYVFQRKDYGKWFQVQKIVSMDRKENASFGLSIAVHGDFLVVGAPNESNVDNSVFPFPNTGAIYIYRKAYNDKWEGFQKLLVVDRKPEMRFGSSLSINGNYLAAGTIRESFDTNNENEFKASGAVYMFKYEQGIWTEIQKIVPADRGENYLFGKDIDIDGNTMIVGASSRPLGEELYVGGAYIYRLVGDSIWEERQCIVPADGNKQDNFGYSVNIQGDLAIIGSACDYQDANNSNTMLEAGSAYLFAEDDCGVWRQVQKFTANHRGYSANFGISCAFSGDYILIGADKEELDYKQEVSKNDAGAVYIFKYMGHQFPPCVEEDDDFEGIRTTITVSVELCGITLTSDQPNAQYQWIKCDESLQPLHGETNRSFTPEENGRYAVMVTKDTLSEISECISVKVMDTDQPSDNENNTSVLPAFKVSPVPSEGTFEVEIIGDYDDSFILEVINPYGIVMIKKNVVQRVTFVDLRGKVKGLYVVRLTSDGGTTKKPVLIR